MELYSFLFTDPTAVNDDIGPLFPSPYGVIFILTIMVISLGGDLYVKFPSPYRVISILTYGVIAINHNLGVIEFPSPYGVIFILIL